MCLLVFALQQHKQFPFILIANRDEYYSRPSLSAKFWEDFPDVLAGRDQLAYGTWLGINRNGRIAAVTNHEDAVDSPAMQKSRGCITTNFLTGNDDTEEYLAKLEQERNDYNGYGVIFGTTSELRYQSNCEAKHTVIKSGIYALSNHLLDSPWPKVIESKAKLKELIQKDEELDPEELFKILRRPKISPQYLKDSDSPASPNNYPIYVQHEHYGTRCSTVVLVDSNNQVTFEERSFKPKSRQYSERYQYTFQIEPTKWTTSIADPANMQHIG